MFFPSTGRFPAQCSRRVEWPGYNNCVLI
jgi:hypothetical protein